MKTKFGFDQLVNETPLWAKWSFRVTLLLVAVATFIIAADPAITDAVKVRINVYLEALTMTVYGLSKMFGISDEAQ